MGKSCIRGEQFHGGGSKPADLGWGDTELDEDRATIYLRLSSTGTLENPVGNELGDPEHGERGGADRIPNDVHGAAMWIILTNQLCRLWQVMCLLQDC